MVVCRTAVDHHPHDREIEPASASSERHCTSNKKNINNKKIDCQILDDGMDVQRAKKCKLWPDTEHQNPRDMAPPAPSAPSAAQRKQHADPCPALQPFFHQVRF